MAYPDQAGALRQAAILLSFFAVYYRGFIM
jgi:hypothetical protein